MAAVDEAQSSSPASSPQSLSDTIAVAEAPVPRPRFLVPGDVVNNNNPLPAAVRDVASNAKPSTNTSHDADTTKPPAKRRQTKKKDVAAVDNNNKGDDKPKEKKTRKPRTVDPNKTPASRSKKQKTGDAPHDPTAASRQPTIQEMVGHFQTPMQPPQVTQQHLHPAQILREDLSTPITAPITRPQSSGQRYDPIRAEMTMDPYPSIKGPPPPQASPQIHRASASPAIASLINPPIQVPTNPAPSPAVVSSMPAPPSKRPSVPTIPSSSLQSQATTPLPGQDEISLTTATATSNSAMDLDPVCDPQPKSENGSSKAETKEKKEKPVTKTASAAPKPKRSTPPPTRTTGSGLLSNSDLFGGPFMVEDDRTRHGVDIDIRIVLNPQGNNTINIAQEIMKKYGRDAINPRAAAHREHLLKVASMANRLEGGSGDEMSLNSDNEDSNAEMGGMDDEKKTDAADGEKKIRRRKKKVEDYDKDDDFIDDTELAWQEGAAVAKDGFFVYSGPLVPPGEDAKIERYAASPSCTHKSS